MKTSISFPEIQSLITEKAHQPISLSFVDEKTIRVSYPVDLGFIKKDISANLIIKELMGSDLLMELSTAFGSDMILTTLLSLFKNKIPEGLLEKRPDSQLLLHLGQIEQVKAVFDKIDVKDLHVLNEGLEVEGMLKA